MKILYLDPNSEDEHINFNNIYIKHLYKENLDLTFSFRAGYEKKISLPKRVNIISIPECFFESDLKSSINYRYNFFKKINFLKKTIDLNQFDFILFSSYDEISLFFCNLKQKLILVNHNNLQNLNNIKKKFYRRISNNNIQVVFDDASKFYLIQQKLSNLVFKINHGLPPKFEENSNSDTIFNNLLNIDSIDIENKRIVLFPSKSSTDIVFLKELNNDKNFITYIENNNIFILFRNKFNEMINSPNIFVIDGFISHKDYVFLMMKSDIICLKYKENFKYRASGVFFEAIANDKKVLVNEINSFLTYSKYFSYNPFFSNIRTLISKIEELTTINNNNLFPNKNMLNPNFNELFNYIKNR